MTDLSKTGIVFNIQKFSVNDGPGIRTVVFLKGCPLHCKWCSNPESQLPQVQIMHDNKKCLKGMHCKDVCPERAISFQNERIHIQADYCNACGKCVLECPAEALSIEGKERTVKEVMDIVKQDEVFYEESHGGMTISGGELFMQWEFARELFIAAKEAGIHTCCETTGCVSNEIFLKVLPYIDYVFMDVKHWDNQKHILGTGVAMDSILTNIRSVIESGKAFLPRIPVIPDFNSSLNDAEGFSRLFGELGIKRVQLLPFHQFGENKYNLLDKEYSYHDTPALHKEELEDYVEVFHRHQIDAFF